MKHRRQVEVDLEAKGLLEGVHGPARTGRELLVRELLADGFTVEDLRDAVAKDRIALLPIERLLRSDRRHVPRYSVEQVAELAGVSLEDLQAANAALGLPVATPGVSALSEVDLALARQLAVALAAGLSLEIIAEVDRTIARGVRKMVAASRTAVIETTLRPGMTERLAAHAWKAAAPLVTNVTSRIALAFEAHLLNLIEDDHIGAARIGAGQTAEVRAVSVAFVDLVGFTELGELLSPEALGGVARRLERMAAGLVSPPTILAKTIGDALMLVSRDPRDLLDTTLALVDQAGVFDGFPPIRAGVAHGDANERGGEWYGETVNLASRITDAAPPGAVIASDALRQQTAEAFRWTPFVAGRLKGVQRQSRLYTVTRIVTQDPAPTRSEGTCADGLANEHGQVTRRT
jgi:adenylate cyclase